MIDQKAVSDIYACYRRAMASVGWCVRLPAHTDPSKTYAYRAISKFLEQAKLWDLNDSITKALVREVVQYGKRNSLLSKGTALLNMKSVLKICFEYLQNEVAKVDRLIADLRRSKQFLDSKTNNLEDVQQLVSKRRQGGFTNFTQWHRAGDLSVDFIAISSVCQKVLTQLPTDERSEFPTDTILLKMRIKILSDYQIREAAAQILGDDILLSGISVER